MEKFKYILAIIITLFSLMVSSALSAATEIGKVIYVRGVASANQANSSNPLRILGRNARLFKNDVISVNKKSFAMIEMLDGTKMTLRPNTQLKLSQYDYKPAKPTAPSKKLKNVNNQDARGNVLLHLLRGGFRSITGAISKSSKNSYRIKTSTATIGIRGTEFDARICVDDCLETPGAKSIARSLTDKKVVGRVAFMGGSMSAQYKQQKKRQLVSGAPLYEGDHIISDKNGYGVFAFSDKSRITLTRNSEFHIKEYSYLLEKPTKNKSVIELLRGGFRALTGLIAKSNRDNVKFNVMAVTIGIRGTGFDIICDGVCRNKSNGRGGMNINVWKGKIALGLDSGEQIIEQGQSFYIASKQTSAKRLNKRPAAIRNIKAPRPDKQKINHDDLFSGDIYDVSTHTSGLYVSLYDGFIELEDNDGNIRGIGAGESIKASSDGIKRLLNQPAFQVNDLIPRPSKFNPEFVNFLDFINQDDSGDAKNCKVK